MFVAGHDFTCSGGVCSPLTTEALRTYKELQAYVNYGLERKGSGLRIDVDGDIGPSTISAMHAAYNAGVPVYPPVDASEAAEAANGYITAYRNNLGTRPSNPFEDAFNWLTSFFTPKPSAPKPAPSTPGAPPAAPSSGSGISNTTLLLAGGGLLAFALWRRKKGRRK